MFDSKLIASMIFIVCCILSACNTPKEIDKAFEIIDDEAYEIFSVNAQLEILDSGFVWTEGPLWLNTTNQLIFNDIPQNKTFSWSTKSGTQVYLSPSGYTGDLNREGEQGANGMVLNTNGQLILCQHGDRRIAKMETSIDNPTPKFQSIVEAYQGLKFSSPNDATISKWNCFLSR